MILFWGNRPVHRALGVVSTGALLFVGLALLADVWYNGIQVVQVSNWPAPYGIALVADLLSAIMVVLAGLMGFAVASPVQDIAVSSDDSNACGMKLR